MYLTIHFKLREDGGYTFADTTKIHLDWEDTAGLHFQLTNLFNGDKSLEDSAHALLNESWRSIFEILRPSLSKAIEAIIKDYMQKLLGYLPFKHFFDDFQ